MVVHCRRLALVFVSLYSLLKLYIGELLVSSFMAEHRTLPMSEVGVLDSSPESSCMRVRNMAGHLIAEYRGPIAVEIGLVFTRLLLLVKSRYGVPSSCVQLECAFAGFVDHDFVVEASCIFCLEIVVGIDCSGGSEEMICA